MEKQTRAETGANAINKTKENCKTRVEILGEKINLLNKLKSREVEFLLSKLPATPSPNRFLSNEIITNRENHVKNAIPNKLADNFKEWYNNSNKEQFEAIIPLHIQHDKNSSKEEGGHWVASRIIFIKDNNDKIKVEAEAFDSIGEGSKCIKLADDLLKDISDKIIDNPDYSYSFSQKINKRLQPANTESCGYYMIDFCRKLAETGKCDANKLSEGYLEDSNAKIKLFRQLQPSAEMKIETDEPKSKETTQHNSDPTPESQQKEEAKEKAKENPKETTTKQKPKDADIPTQEANLNGNPNTSQQEKAKQTLDIKTVKRQTREIILKNYYEKTGNNNFLKDGISGKIIDQSKIDEAAKAYLDKGEFRDNFPLHNGDDLKYLPKEILNPPVKDGEKKFMAKISVSDGYFHIKADMPIGEANIKIKDGETASDILISIQFNKLEKDRWEFVGIDSKTKAGKTERDKRLSDFDSIRGHGASK